MRKDTAFTTQYLLQEPSNWLHLKYAIQQVNLRATNTQKQQSHFPSILVRVQPEGLVYGIQAATSLSLHQLLQKSTIHSGFRQRHHLLIPKAHPGEYGMGSSNVSKVFFAKLDGVSPLLPNLLLGDSDPEPPQLCQWIQGLFDSKRD